MKIRKFYLSPEGDGAGANAQTDEEKKAAELKLAEETAAKAKADEEAKKLADEEAKKKANQSVTLTEEEKKSINELKAKAEKGDALTDDEINLLKKGGIDIQVDDEELQDGIKPSEFWNKAKELSGIDLEGFDFNKEINPDNVLDFANHYAETEIGNFEKTLKEKAPKEYLALEMRLNGEDPSSLYKENNYSFVSQELKKTDTDRAKEIIRAGLALKGVDDEVITDLISNYEDKGKLIEVGEKERKFILDTEESKIKDEEIKLQNKKREEKQAIDTFVSVVQSVLQKGEIGDLKIPDRDKKLFQDFVLNSTQYNNGKFVVVKELNNDNLIQELQTEFYRYRKGEIADLVKTQAKSLIVKRLKDAASNNGASVKGGVNTPIDGSKKKVKTLSDFTVYN